MPGAVQEGSTRSALCVSCSSVVVRLAEDEIVLKDLVARRRQPDPIIDDLCRLVLSLDVQSHAADIAASPSLLQDRCVHSMIHTAPPPGTVHIDALDPPEGPIAPVAPLIRDEQLSDHLR